MHRILRDISGIVLIGDGVVGALVPVRHSRRYEMGPSPWRSAMRFFVRRPALTRALAAAELAAGLWVATGGHDDGERHS